MPDLSGKAALVTGCASGIGAATVRRLVADGAQVLGTDIDATRGAALCAEAGARFAVQDTADRARWAEVVAEAVAAFGRLDIVVNNAGMVGGGPIEDADLDAWDRVIAVNLTGTMLGCRAAIGAMKANPGGASGSIINIASTTAMAPLPTDAAYSASKGAVRVLSKSVATWAASQAYPSPCKFAIAAPIERSRSAACGLPRKVRPPLGWMFWPVTNASSLHSHKHACATSSLVLSRPSG